MADKRIDYYDLDKLPLQASKFYQYNKYIIDKFGSYNVTNMALRMRTRKSKKYTFYSRFIFSPQLNKPIPMLDFIESQYMMRNECANCNSEMESDMRVIDIANLLCDECVKQKYENKFIIEALNTFINRCRYNLNESQKVIFETIHKYNSKNRWKV